MIPESRSPGANILTGTAELIDEYLRSVSIDESYGTKTACQRLSGQRSPFNESTFGTLLGAMFAKIEANWQNNKRSISRENWRWEPRPVFAPRNKSPEVTLERSIIRAATARPWVNQVPTSSGLYSAYTDRTRNVDLVFELGTNAYEFIELKVESNNPVYAAFEIVRNALLFLFTRKLAGSSHHPPKGDRNLLLATHVELVVLAPSGYYSSYDFSHFERELNRAISKYAAAEFEMTMTFKFKSFRPSFNWSVTTEQTTETAAKLLAAVDARAAVQWRTVS